MEELSYKETQSELPTVNISAGFGIQAVWMPESGSTPWETIQIPIVLTSLFQRARLPGSSGVPLLLLLGIILDT